MQRSHRYSWYFVLCTCLLLASGSCLAQKPIGDAEPPGVTLPDWVVLVLKPIGNDRVRPVTGVVVAAEGLVIVPLDFASPGDQIIVLDGGTDIIANGRAAKVEQQFTQAGLTLLSAPGLKRRPAGLSSVPLSDGEEIHLAAFPPAELIAEGAAPLQVATQVSVPTDSVQVAATGPKSPSIAEGKALPNITGPLVDACGNLVGFSSADGVQSMDTSRAPAYLWKEGLLRALKDLPAGLTETPCPAADSSTAADAQLQTENEDATQVQEEPVAPIAESAEPEIVESGDSLVWAEQPSPARAKSPWPAWLGWLAVVLLAGLVWLVLKWRKIYGSRNELSGDKQLTARNQESRQPGEIPGVVEEASQADCTIEINGRLPDGQPFVSSCHVHGSAINVLVGRGQADLAIDCLDVQREHARLSGSGDLLTITDLGSSRGTWINRVPCLKGEIMFITAEDTIFLGDVSFQVAVRLRQPPSKKP